MSSDAPSRPKLPPANGASEFPLRGLFPLLILTRRTLFDCGRPVGFLGDSWVYRELDLGLSFVGVDIRSNDGPIGVFNCRHQRGSQVSDAI